MSWEVVCYAEGARVVGPGFPHHVTQRGNYRQFVFEEDADREQYLAWIKEYSDKYGLEIWAYCLMDNHVHFIVVPSNHDALSKTFNQSHMRYSRHFNVKKGQQGHLWQGRFYSCILDEAHLFAAVRYVENNPVRAGIVKNPEDYRWSSAAAHVNKTTNPLLSPDVPLLNQITDWREFLLMKDEEKLLKTLKTSTQTGRPAGSEGFTEKLEDILKIQIKPKPPGRPKKISEEK